MANNNVGGNTGRNVRNGGNTYTSFQWNNKIIGFARGVSHKAPAPVTAPVSIQPMDEIHPIQILTPSAIGPGTLSVAMFELYNRKVWDELLSTIGFAFGDINDLAQVFVAVAANSTPISCVKVINPPVIQGNKPEPYGDLYHNCVISDIRDDEDIDITTMEIVKAITIQYTHMTRIGKKNANIINQSQLPPTQIGSRFNSAYYS